LPQIKTWIAINRRTALLDNSSLSLCTSWHLLY